MSIEFEVRASVGDAELSELHAHAFGDPDSTVVPWSSRLERHSLLWVTAIEDGRIVGFVNVIGDGGKHAVLLDTVVDPNHQGRGIGRRLVEVAADASRERGCEWLHVDFEDDLAGFYLGACGFGGTTAGLRKLA